MDLGFSLLGRSRRRIVHAAELGALIAGCAARQAASPTARAQARLAPALAIAPASFHAGVAALLSGRQRL